MNNYDVVWSGDINGPSRGLIHVPAYPARHADPTVRPVPEWANPKSGQPINPDHPAVKWTLVDGAVDEHWSETASIADRAGVHRATARMRLAQLVQMGIVERNTYPVVLSGKTYQRAVYRKVRP